MSYFHINGDSEQGYQDALKARWSAYEDSFLVCGGWLLIRSRSATRSMLSCCGDLAIERFFYLPATLNLTDQNWRSGGASVNLDVYQRLVASIHAQY